MSNSQVPTIIATDEHFIRCTIDTRGQRLLDSLNESQSRYLEIEDVNLYRRAATTPIATLNSAVLDKRNIVFAIPTLKSHEAPGKRVNSYTEKQTYDAFVIAAGYEIRGSVQNTGYQDAASLLCQRDGHFIPFPQASINYGASNDEQPASQVVLVNTRCITMMHIDKASDTSSETLAAAIREIVSSSSP